MIAFLVLGAMICLMAVWHSYYASLKLRAFRERYPPISDEAFLQRCQPGTNPEIALKVRKIVSDQLGIEYERIYPEQNFASDLFAD